jgi:sigma-B regulation protein RsbU (phosphoserine phosphatase)
MATIINAMNHQLTQDVLDSGRFMTLICLELDTGARQPQWVRAGHSPALLYTPRRDRFEELKGSGMALGVEAAYRYTSHQGAALTAGQIIAIGTDGIWEAFSRTGKAYGMRRFRSVIRNNAHHTAAAIVDGVYDDVKRFTYGSKQEDDITLVVVKVTENLPVLQDWSI